jgi:drug/metabolite transporter (DMT)-like permease
MADSLRRMSRVYLPLLLSLAAIWGASFMFIKVAGRELQPTTMMSGRILFALVVMLGLLVGRFGTRGAAAQLGAVGFAPYALGVVNAAIPFTLIAWGERHVDSGVAAIGNASMPIFVALLALRFRRSERSSGLALVGIFVGLAGVAVLAGIHPRGGWWAVAGTLAVVVASVSYAIATLWGQHLVAKMPMITLTTTALIGAAVVLLPLGLAQAPGSMPSLKTIACVVALGVAGTAVGQLIFYRMLETDGSAKASLVTYLLPVTALFYGASLLGEPITVEELAGLVLILAGVALGSGIIGAARRRAPAPAAQ